MTIPAKTYLIIIVLLLCINSRATTIFKNTAQAESAERNLMGKPEDSNKADKFIELANWYLHKEKRTYDELNKSYVLANKAKKIITKLDYKTGYAHYYLLSSEIAQLETKYNLAKTYAEKAIACFSNLNNPDALGESYVMLWSSTTLSKGTINERIAALQKADVAFAKANNKKRQADTLKELADLYQINYDLALSLSSLKKALSLYKVTGEKVLFGVYDLMGNVYVMLGDYKEGIRYELMALKNAEELDAENTGSYSTICNRTAVAYMYIHEYEKVAFYNQKALDIALRLNDINSIAIITLNQADMYISLKNTPKALEILNTLVKKYPEISSDPDPYIDWLFLDTHTKMKHYKEAEKYSLIIIRKSNLISEPSILERSYSILIAYYLSTKQYGKAQKYVSLIDGLIESGKLKEFPLYMYNKFRLDSISGNYLSAIKHYQKFKNKSESILNEKKIKQINQLNILYETEKKDRDIETLKEKSVIQQNNLIHSQLIQRITLGGLILVIIILFLLYHSYSLKQKTNKALELKQQEINQKNISLEHMVSEKEWLLREIHHRVKNNLHMVTGLLESQTEFLKSQEAFDAIAESQNRVQAMSLIHQKLYQTENMSLTDMPSYIHELTDYLEECFGKGPKIRYQLDIDKVEFPLSHSIPIGLILNETITNSIKYAFDGNDGIISISLKKTSPKDYRLCISDNGKGLPPDFDIVNSSSLGLRLIQGLSQDIHADFRMYNNNGTCIELLFTLEETFLHHKAS